MFLDTFIACFCRQSVVRNIIVSISCSIKFFQNPLTTTLRSSKSLPSRLSSGWIAWLGSGLSTQINSAKISLHILFTFPASFDKLKEKQILKDGISIWEKKSKDQKP